MIQSEKQNREWRENAERFIQFYINREAKSPQDALNQVYAKGPFAGGSVGSVLAHAKELLKTTGHTTQFGSGMPLIHHRNCTYRNATINDKAIPCDCGLYDAIDKLQEKNNG